MNRNKAYLVLEGGVEAGGGAKAVSIFLVTLILLNAFAVVVESIDGNYRNYATWFDAFEFFSVAVFSVEYLLRIWVAPEGNEDSTSTPARARWKYALSAPAIIDLVAILPAYLAAFFGIDLRTLRMLRLLRLLKLHKYFGGLYIFFSVVRRELITLLSAVATIVVLILLAATIMYAVESRAQPEAFGSVLESFWWAAVTMTTVGYGDVTPITPVGQIIATLMMLLGVGIVAMPAGMLAARFSEELQSRRDELQAEIDLALRDGHISEVEQSKLNQVRTELVISEDHLERIVQLMTVQHEKTRSCPHCGEQIDLFRSDVSANSDKIDTSVA